MLPANPLGVMYCRAFSLTRSLPMRSSGNPSFHACSPFLRYETATVALRLSSPSIFHSKPNERSVAGSTMNSFAVVLSAANREAVQRSDRKKPIANLKFVELRMFEALFERDCTPTRVNLRSIVLPISGRRMNADDFNPIVCDCDFI